MKTHTTQAGEIQLQSFPNEHIRSFGVRKRLTRELIEFWMSPSHTESKPAPVYVRRIFEIEGVVEVSVDQYAIRVIKAETFSWEEIEPRIIATIELEIIGEKTN